MNPVRYAQKIEVGVYEQRIGFTIHYVDGERAHFLFAKDIAKQLTEQLGTLIAELEYLERQMPPQGPSDRISMQEHINMELTPPPEPQAGDDLGINSGN